MQIYEVDNNYEGYWHANWASIASDYSNANEVIKLHNPYIYIKRDIPLTEATYKELARAIDPNFLRQGVRAAALRGVRYKGFNGHDMMVFYVTSSEIDKPGMRGWGREYICIIQFLQWDDIGGDPDLTPREKALMMLWTSDIKVFCDDPSFLFWGYQYILTQIDASIYPELRPPYIRNPQYRGVVCKHLNRVLKALPFYSGDIAQEVTKQWGGKIDKKSIDAIRHRNDLYNKVNNLPAGTNDGLTSDEDDTPDENEGQEFNPEL
jgi:hypothetical protein